MFTETITPTVAGGVVSFTLANTPVKPGSVRIAAVVETTTTADRNLSGADVITNDQTKNKVSVRPPDNVVATNGLRPEYTIGKLP